MLRWILLPLPLWWIRPLPSYVSGRSGVERLIAPGYLDSLVQLVDARLFEVHYDARGLERPFAYTHPISGHVSCSPGVSSPPPVVHGPSDGHVDSLRWQQREHSRAVRRRRRDHQRRLRMERRHRAWRLSDRVSGTAASSELPSSAGPCSLLWAQLPVFLMSWMFLPLLLALVAGPVLPPLPL